MTAVLIVIAVLLAGLVAVGAVLAARVGRAATEARLRDARFTPVNRLTREKLIVTLKSGAAFEGVLWEADDRCWVLRSTSALGAAERGENIPVDGELLLFVADIAHAQKP